MCTHSAPLLAALALALAPLAAAAQSPFRVGEPLPALRLPAIDGERTLDLREFRGRKLVLFEFAAW